MTQRQDCARRGGAVDEEKVVVRKGDLTLAGASGKIERSADAFPVQPPPDVMGTQVKPRPKAPGRPRDKGEGSGAR